MRHSRPSLRVVAAVLAGGLLVGCAGDDEVDTLREEVEALRDDVRTTDELREQIDALEAELAELRAVTVGEEDDDDAAGDPLGELSDELDAATARLDELTATRPSLADVRELAESTADEATSDLRRSLGEVRAIAERALGEIEILEDVIEVLQRRVDRLEAERG